MNRPSVPESVPHSTPHDATQAERSPIAHPLPESPTSTPHTDPQQVDTPRQIGPYRILRQLGEGGMSRVYLAYDPEEERNVAVKVLADHLAHARQFVQRFYREANMSRMLDHPNIVKGFALGHDHLTHQHYLVLEYVDGPSLQRLLDENGPLPVGLAVRAVLDVARAIEYLHQNDYVHRDIKPGNILIAPNGQAKLIDLGLAKHLEQTIHLTMGEQGLGTSYYMPFEQAKNPSFVDGRSDIFALGATLYHLLTGEVPFVGLDHLEIAAAKERGDYLPLCRHNPDLPKILDDILAKMLVRDPRGRFNNAAELIVALEATGLADLDAVISPQPDHDLTNTQPIELAATRVDLPLVCPVYAKQNAESPTKAVWSLRYRRANGVWINHSATTQQILDWCESGLLPTDVLVARCGQQQYRPLRAYPEFRDVPESTDFVVNGSIMLSGPIATWGISQRIQLLLTMGVALFIGMLFLLLTPHQSPPDPHLPGDIWGHECTPICPPDCLPEPYVRRFREPPPPPKPTDPGLV